MTDYQESKEAIRNSLWIGINAELDNDSDCPDLDPAEIDWVAAWLAGEGFVKQ